MGNIVPFILLGLLFLLILGFGILHWRYHPQATPIESYADLQNSLQKGKPTLLQFYAPL